MRLSVAALAFMAACTNTNTPLAKPTPASVRDASSSPAAPAPRPPPSVQRLGSAQFRHADAVTVVAASADGKYVASGARDNSVRVWDAATGATLYAPTLSGLIARVEHAAFVGDTFVYASGANPLTVVATSTWTEARQLATCGREWTRALAPSPDGKRVAVTCEGINELRLQHLDGGAPVVIRGIANPVQAAWSADGAWIAVVSGDSVQLVDVQTRKVGKSLPKLKRAPNAIAFAPRGAVLAFDTRTASDQVVLYDVAAQKEVAAYDVRIGVTALGFSRDGTRLVFAPIVGPRSLSVIDLASGARHDVLRPTRVIHSLAFGVRADRVWLAHDHGVRDFDLDRAIDVLPPAGHIGEITALAFSPDGKTLASGSSDATIRLWDLATGGARLLEILTETWGVGSDLATFPLGPLTELWWSADGKLLNSIDGVGSELRARVWNAEDGAQREARHARAVAFDGGAAVITDAMRAAHAGNVSATALAPDGKTVATGGRDGQVFVWP